MTRVFFKDMEEKRVYTALSPKGIFTKIKGQVWFMSYWNDAVSTWEIANDKDILSATDLFVTVNRKDKRPVFPKQVTLK